METAILLIQCPDQKGIVAKISDFVFRKNANIIRSDQYSTDPQDGVFFMRLEFCFDVAILKKTDLERDFGILAQALGASWQIHYRSIRMRMGILVSKLDHCLVDILYRCNSGELELDIPCILSNHADLEPIARNYSIPFYHVPVSKDNKAHAEKETLSLLNGTTDFIVLARYMQVLSSDFLNLYKGDIVNIHHSFLPSFKGADPYRQAYDRGVKIIGATAHYVTAELDEGPIIDQSVERVSHKDDVAILKRKGKHLEKMTLGNAIMAHSEHRVIKFRNKTILFE